MSIAEREKQILRVSQQGFHHQLNEALTSKLKTEVVDTVKTVLESALKEEVTEFLKTREKKPYRSGYYYRGVNTQYGQISDLAVPKLREGNKEREWQILARYQRSLGNLLDWMCVLYVIGLSLRDLQEALYLILGKVLSVSAVNQITLNVQKQIESRRQVPLTRIPKMILVDGVWVEIQYTMDGEFKVQSSKFKVLSWLWLHFLPPLKVLLSLMEGIVAGSILIGFATTVIFGLAVIGLRRLFSMPGISFIKSVSLLILTPNPLWLHAHNIFSDYIVSNSLSTLISTFLHNFCQSIRLKAIVKRRSRAESPSSATVSNLTLTFFHLFFRFSYS